MNRETRTIEFPQSGVTVGIITYWSWGEKQELQRFLVEGINVDVSSPEAANVKLESFSLSRGIEMRRRVIELAVKSVRGRDGAELGVKDVFDLPESDVEFLLAEINKLDAEKKN